MIAQVQSSISAVDEKLSYIFQQVQDQEAKHSDLIQLLKSKPKQASKKVQKQVEKPKETPVPAI